MRRSIPLVLFAVAACGPKITTVPTNPAPRPLSSRAAATVEVFTTKLPPRAYVEVAVFTASKGKAEDHIEALRERAAAYGCDGLVFTVMPSEQQVAVSNTSTKPGELGSTGYGTSTNSSSATCVVWSAAAAPTAAAATTAAPP